MPGGRSRRGGVRTGTPGTSYSNRTDLNRNRTLPVTAPTGLPYGQHKQLVDTQKQVPIQTPGAPTAGPPGPVSPTPPAPAPPIIPLSAPSQRPDEAITHGLPVGPGPGPEVLGLGQPRGDLASVLEQVAAAAGSSDLAFLAQRARNLGQ